MPWFESEEHNRRLWEALGKLAGERGALERLTGAINNDRQAQATDRARSGGKHQANKALLAPSTLDRWQKEGLDRVRNAQSHKKRLVYEFLERSPDFPTDLHRPEGRLPPGLLAYAAENAARLARPLVKDLSNLDGTFELFRQAWTDSGDSDRVTVSRLLFTTNRGFTGFREELEYTDTSRHGTVVPMIDEGGVLFTADSIVLLGFGVSAERVKLFVAENWYNSIDSHMPVTFLSGTMICISNRMRQRAYRFIATRTRKSFSEIETGTIDASNPRLSPQVLEALENRSDDRLT